MRHGRNQKIPQNREQYNLNRDARRQLEMRTDLSGGNVSFHLSRATDHFPREVKLFGKR